MPVTTIVIALVLAAVVGDAVVRGERGRPGWGAFAGWLVAGFLSGLATISFAIGLLVLPLAVVAIAVSSRFGVWPAIGGFAGGAGLVGVLVWALNVGESDSPSYTSWLAGGAALALAAAAGFAAWRRAA